MTPTTGYCGPGPLRTLSGVVAVAVTAASAGIAVTLAATRTAIESVLRMFMIPVPPIGVGDVSGNVPEWLRVP
jgi:hypothetical protein